jgi:ATP-dependent Clp protease, protease subunit
MTDKGQPMTIKTVQPLKIKTATTTTAKPTLTLEYGEFVLKYVNEELGVFAMSGPVNDVMHSATTHTLRYIASLHPKRPILCEMSTYGGDILNGLALYDLIPLIPVPVDIRATGACMSMGVIILQAARKRSATPYAQFMLHQLQGSNTGDLGAMRDQHKHMEDLQKKLNAILANRTGMSTQKINSLINRKDYYISAQEALELNIIDAIEGEQK